MRLYEVVLCYGCQKGDYHLCYSYKFNFPEISEVFLETYQTSKMESYAKIING